MHRISDSDKNGARGFLRGAAFILLGFFIAELIQEPSFSLKGFLLMLAVGLCASYGWKD